MKEIYEHDENKFSMKNKLSYKHQKDVERCCQRLWPRIWEGKGEGGLGEKRIF